MAAAPRDSRATPRSEAGFNGTASQLSVVATVFTRNLAIGGKGGFGGAGGDAFGGDATDNMSGPAATE
jgi:hypothetical protein